MRRKKRKKKIFHQSLYKIFYDPTSPGFAPVNDFLAGLTLLSVVSIILETVTVLSEYELIFNTIEYVTVFFFTLEYIARIIAKKRNAGSYAFSFFGIIDLLAILPTYLGFTNLTFLKTARVLRILRLLRMVRLAKVTRTLSHKRHDLEDFQSLYRWNIGIYLFALLSTVVFFGTLIYIVEGNKETFTNIPLGMLWSMKLLLGGVAQAKPATVAGELIAIMARFSGLVLLGLLLAITGNIVKRWLFGTDKIET